MSRQPSTGTKSSGLRRGAWSSEEDTLLRQCVEKYGEGSWHRVPARAGLNRCRKSCRLRWLNYLHPDIKRGEFEDDEVDLIKKLHKLLGNRWSLIAGRIPGRTANDIKNYWNTHFKEKLPSNDVAPNVVKAIRPQPCFFCSNSTPSKRYMPEKNVGQKEQGSHSEKNTAKIPVSELPSSSCMEEPIKRIEEGAPSSRAIEVEELVKMSTNEQQSTQLASTSTAEGLAGKLDDHISTASWMMEESLFNVNDLLVDVDDWGYLLEMDNYTCNEK